LFVYLNDTPLHFTPTRNGLTIPALCNFFPEHRFGSHCWKSHIASGGGVVAVCVCGGGILFAWLNVLTRVDWSSGEEWMTNGQDKDKTPLATDQIELDIDSWFRFFGYQYVLYIPAVSVSVYTNNLLVSFT